MLKILTRKLLTLFVLCAALATVLSTPAYARSIYCAKFIDGTGQCFVVCCTSEGQCIESTC